MTSVIPNTSTRTMRKTGKSETEDEGSAASEAVDIASHYPIDPVIDIPYAIFDFRRDDIGVDRNTDAMVRSVVLPRQARKAVQPLPSTPATLTAVDSMPESSMRRRRSGSTENAAGRTLTATSRPKRAIGLH